MSSVYNLLKQYSHSTHYTTLLMVDRLLVVCLNQLPTVHMLLNTYHCKHTWIITAGYETTINENIEQFIVYPAY